MARSCSPPVRLAPLAGVADAKRVGSPRSTPASQRHMSPLQSAQRRRTHPWSEVCEQLGDDYVRRGLDQREVGKRLRKVPQVPPCLWVELLGVEAKGRGDPEQPLHQVTGSLHLAHDRKRRHKPKRADQERSLLAGKPVIGLLGAVTQDEAVLSQLLGDGKNCVP